METVKDISNAPHYQWGNGCDGWHLLQSDSLSVIQEQMPPGSAEQMHYHNKAQQLFYILSGTATFYIDGVQVNAVAGQSVHVPAKTLHSITNHGEQAFCFLVVSQPKSHGDRIDIIPYREELKEAIKELNYEWLQKYFSVEPGDITSLANPTGEIIDKGGSIYYAMMQHEIVGTVSLLKKTNDIFEIGKMAVTEKAQGNGIGQALMQYCLQQARQQRIKKLVLYSNTSLLQAIHLYRKFGFTETTLEQGLYKRADIKMEKYL
jgi:mannose-6-phosphate isomerase-like protein (cupin superfamily)/predicted GNAT family acetyltransferase